MASEKKNQKKELTDEELSQVSGGAGMPNKWHCNACGHEWEGDFYSTGGKCPDCNSFNIRAVVA